MPSDNDILTMLKNLFSENANCLVGHRVLLFGPRARGDAKPRSDLDLAVVGTRPLPLKDFCAIADALDELPTLHRFDWLDLARMSERFRASALVNTVLYEA